MGIGFESGISQSVGSSVGGLQGGARFLTPPSGIPIPPEPLPPVPAGIAAGALSLLAPVAAFFGAFFLFPGAAGDPNEAKNLRQPVYNPNTGNKSIGVSYTVGLYVQDFVNGCDDGLYELFYDYGLAYDSLPSVSFELVSSYPSCGGTSGSIRKFIANGEDTGFRPQGIEMSLIPIGFKKGGDRPSVFYGWRKIGSGGATPPTPIAPPIETVPSGYTGTGGVTPEEKAKKILPAKIASTLGTSGVKSFGAVGGGSP
ncbi:hypothetical protein, partial [Pseudanabaena sp. 'Roaring Creek']|uniref:hypothetical protein n=1 Tax=Pseudanabaena sp. 'Roaring Creek' TaxID=1681830 RepID=UPI0012E24FBF